MTRNNASSSENVHPLLSCHIKIQSVLDYFRLFYAYSSPDSDKVTSSLGEAVYYG